MLEDLQAHAERAMCLLAQIQHLLLQRSRSATREVLQDSGVQELLSWSTATILMTMEAGAHLSGHVEVHEDDIKGVRPSLLHNLIIGFLPIHGLGHLPITHMSAKGLRMTINHPHIHQGDAQHVACPSQYAFRSFRGHKMLMNAPKQCGQQICRRKGAVCSSEGRMIF